MSALLDTLAPTKLPAHAEALRSQVREFLASELPAAPADVRSRSWIGFDPAFTRKLAARGWVGLTLPRAWGGAGLDAFSRFVLVEELLVAGAPVGAHWIADRQSAPLILRYGSEAQQRAHIPRICAGESYFCIGMSEPDSGSDLASVRTRATRVVNGGQVGWQLDGRKIWTTNAHRCHYMIALVRTSGTPADRHGGLSQFIVDLSLPGIHIRPIADLTGDAHFNEVLFDGVQLPEDALVGHEGDGWEQVNSELAFERSGPERLYSAMVLLERWIDSLRARAPAQRRGEQVQAVGRFMAHLAALRSLSIAVTARLVAGESPLTQAALIKDLGTSFEQEIPGVIEAALGSELVSELGSEPGADSGLGSGAEIAPDLWRALAYVSQVAPTFSLRCGTREILRGMIARGLGLR